MLSFRTSEREMTRRSRGVGFAAVLVALVGSGCAEYPRGAGRCDPGRRDPENSRPRLCLRRCAERLLPEARDDAILLLVGGHVLDLLGDRLPLLRSLFELILHALVLLVASCRFRGAPQELLDPFSAFRASPQEAQPIEGRLPTRLLRADRSSPAADALLFGQNSEFRRRCPRSSVDF